MAYGLWPIVRMPVAYLLRCLLIFLLLLSAISYKLFSKYGTLAQ